MPHHRRTGLRRRAGALTLAVVALTASACGGGAAGSGDTVKVGLLANMTGSAATAFGVPFKRGFEMALDDIEKSKALEESDISLELVTEDAKSEVPSAVTGFNRLVQKQVPIVVQDSQSPLGQALAPPANDQKVVLLSGAGSELENKDGYAFRFTDLKTPTNSLAKYLADQGVKRVGAIVATDNPSFDGLADATEAGLPNGFAAKEEITSDDSDFASVLANLRKEKLDAVLLSVLPAQAGNIVLQMKRSGGFEDVQLVGTLAMAAETHTIAGKHAEDIVFPQVWAPGTGKSSEFEKAYEAKYKEKPTAYGGLGYQTAWIVAAAIAQAAESGTKITGEAIRDALPKASQSQMVNEHGILDLKLNADGSATSKGVLAKFAPGGLIVSAEKNE